MRGRQSRRIGRQPRRLSYPGCTKIATTQIAGVGWPALYLNLLIKLAVVLLALSGTALPFDSATDSFDQPLKKQVLDFGPSPYVSGYRMTLSCYFYPSFVVKQYDEGEKGAEWLAIAPLEKGAESCSKSHAANEKVIDPVGPTGWSGYFKGVKGNLVFFDADDGTDGGLPFAIYDARTGKKIFEDSAYDSSMWNKKAADSPFNKLRVSGRDEQVHLRYLRVAETGCNLHLEGTWCWEQVKRRFDLKSGAAPVCSGYKRITTRYESAVAYPVEVSLFPQPTIRTIPGPVKCWPVD